MTTHSLYQIFVDSLDHRPTPQQERVIRSDDPAMVVVAGAGSGKTHTMSLRIAWKIFSGQVNPDEVLGLTFTNKAAAELAERVQDQLASMRNMGMSSPLQVHGRVSNAGDTNNSALPLDGGDRGDDGGASGLSQTQLSLGLSTGAHTGRSNSLGSINRGLAIPGAVSEADDPWHREADAAHAHFAVPTISTYNAFASQIAQSYAMLIGKDPQSRLITDAERSQILTQIVQAWEVPDGDEDPFDVMTISTVVTNAMALADAIINNGITIAQVREYIARETDALTALTDAYSRRKPWSGSEALKGKKDLRDSLLTMPKRSAVLKVVDRYFEYKEQHSLIEFADQVAWAKQILQENPAIGDDLRSRYKLILLDEYQDTSIDQAALLHAAFDGVDSICAVGDPFQAIYGWRGASAAALDDFVRDFKVTRDAQYHLSTAFRNGSAILDVANAVTDVPEHHADSVLPAGVYDGNPSADRVLRDYYRADNTDDSQLPSSYEDFDRPWMGEYNGFKVETELAHEPLSPLPSNGSGRIIHVRRHLSEESDEAIAGLLKKEFDEHYKAWQHNSQGKPYERPTAAVLVRKNDFAQPIIEALKEVGLPYENLVGTSILDYPEVHTLKSLLQVAAFPARGQYLMYLMHFYNIGAADIAALSGVARNMGDSNGRYAANLVDAIDYVREHPDLDSTLTDQARRRIITIAGMLIKVRRDMQLPLAQTVSRAAEYLGLDALIAARRHGATRVQNAIDAFIAMAAQYYEDDAQARGLPDFLEWIDAVEAKEHGGEEESSADAIPGDLPGIDVEPEHGVVQVLTVHKAKGLEWDFVVVPRLVGNDFDLTTGRGKDVWNTNVKTFPTPLRVDAHYVPYFSAQEFLSRHDAGASQGVTAELAAEAASRMFFETRTRLVSYQNSELRRLLYVAVTRPRSLLILGTYDFKDRAQAEKFLAAHNQYLRDGGNNLADDISPYVLSHHFLDNIRAVLGERYEGIVVEDQDNPPTLNNMDSDTTELAQWLGNGEDTDANDSPIAIYDTAESELLRWPDDIDRKLDSDLPTETHDTLNEPELMPEYWQGLESRTQAYIDRLTGDATDELPDLGQYVTASGVVSLMSDPATYARDQVRPIPREPLMEAALGTRVHTRIANTFDAALTLDIDTDAVGLSSDEVDEDRNSVRLHTARAEASLSGREDALYDAFIQSRFAAYPALAIEQAIEVKVGDKPVRCVLDAVFDTSGVKGATRVTIVDWKTGRRPTSKQLKARELQLGLYRLAWHHAHRDEGIALSDISAYFVFLGESDPRRREVRAGDLSEQEITHLFMQKYADAQASLRK
ncbi:MAG: UvrD-helicase domain-containing protein [Arcanobacterium sp.]|nr:UvrD-helicase domain-containing protein [Arcanobacterium sp.]